MAGEIRTYQDLIAWQKSFSVGMEVYRATDHFPDRERFGLTIQLRRSAVSVPSNIAEGFGRGSTADYIRFLKVARGSIYELDTQLLFAKELGYLPDDGYTGLKERLDEAERVLAGLIRSLDR
jgi:four helix bundle protein